MDSPKGHKLKMIRPDLESIPQFDLPAPFSLRRYRPGDEKPWLDMHVHGDRFGTFNEDSFTGQFGTDTDVIVERQYYLCDGAGEPIGTTTAWFDDAETGRVHWVLIVPEFQGRGLAKPMLTTVCNRLRELGHTRAVLGTYSLRVAAVGLYLKFGFLPDIDGREALQAWLRMRDQLPASPLANMGLCEP